MSASRESEYSFHDVVIVADQSNTPSTLAPISTRRDLEKTEATTLAALKEAVAELGLRSCHYETPRELAQNADRHTNDIVWSIYGGEVSRNRMALVPAICESYGLKYIGPDVYGRIICQDKEVSKRLAAECGLETPLYRIVRSSKDLETIRNFPLPFVIKPILEGSSIGIGPENLIRNPDEGRKLAHELLGRFRQPLIIEQFVGGREVSYCAIQATPIKWSLGEVFVEGCDNYFDDHLFDAEEKKNRRLPRDVRTIDSELPSIDKFRLDRLLSILGKYNYCRVDGKLVQGRFVFLEITPDAWIAPSGVLAKSFTNKGLNYSTFIGSVLHSIETDLQDRPASD